MDHEQDRPLPSSHDERLREQREGQPHPDYPRYEPPREPSSEQINAQALARRIAQEKAHYERGFPVAGHNRSRDDRERER